QESVSMDGEATPKTSEFHKKGYILVKDLLSEATIAQMVRSLDTLSGKQRRIGGWTFPDGVTQSPCFWPLIFSEKLIAIVTELIGSNIRYLQHNDLHVGFSSFSWHRDSVSRRLEDGPDWDESEPYRIVRIGVYLQPRGTSSFQLGFVPGSHRPA